MAVGVNQYQQRQRQAEPDIMDDITKGLQVAAQIYGIKSAGQQLENQELDRAAKKELLAQEQLRYEKDQSRLDVKAAQDLASHESGLADRLIKKEEHERKLRGVYLDSDFSHKDFTRSSAPQAGFDEVKIQTDKGVKNIYIKPKEKEESGLDRLIKEDKRAEASAKKEEREKGAKLPATQAEALGDANASFKALEEAKNIHTGNADMFGPFAGRLSSMAGSFEIGDVGKKFKALDAKLKINAQTIGKYLEGGKLTDEDIERYKAMLPNYKDSVEVAHDKALTLQNLISDKQKAHAAAFSEAGYNIGNIKLSPRAENMGVTVRAPLSPEILQKAQNMNPNDIMSAIQLEKIKRRGIGGNLPGGK